MCAIIWPISAGWRSGRNFLAGDMLSYADLAAAAHLSAIDYLGDVPWIEDDAAKAWYARVKSRPSVPSAAQRMAGRRAGVADLCGSRFLTFSGGTAASASAFMVLTPRVVEP